ncbi:cytochrome c oxidase subunit 3 [Mucilaginibacter auburnensis]|uniref:Cytochrome c oxidase subunit 3 n=1 Tax=Mucilaginibacter auburnensis TaxID=1457233 RepID=A0A2H9VSY1_9SPHI|nr:cytochrome c oxidase subunit 3 [Mucilaginibacter auburnensis]PJJ83909.1 cytochrome c oxidase subunit 3 [Mucilaginibacter auburnensis]
MMAQLQQEDKLNLGAKKFNMWIFIFTSFMFFAALTSGFIVYVGGRGGKGLDMEMPSAFIYSTAAILLSSLTIFMASTAAKRLQFAKQRLFLWLTILLGVAFLVIQILGWAQLVKAEAFLVNNNASVSFIYIFTGTHLLHIIAGLALLGYSLYASYSNKPQVKNLYYIQMSSIFWHFVDIIWIYLYVFLLLNQH